ncbi:MAG: hypothetical protein LBU22_04020 [Dysgonamonadaceae bacterium]|jgi:hypothetical protein|nr:hypothetical protein [Dysgonamonadaceae bacterium]
MIHYFNPGHETAILNGSPFYHPSDKVAKMQEDLASLPAWYADAEDYILLPYGKIVSADLIRNCQNYKADGLVNYEDASQSNPEKIKSERVALWGISPQSIYFFEKLNKQYGLQLKIPEWKPEYRFLGSRHASHKVLTHIINTIPEIEKDILPQFFSGITEMENHHIKSKQKHLVKSPYSSSGRGLVWLPPGIVARSEKQIISGMLKRQSCVSLEKTLDKQLDFSMHFEINAKNETGFIGYSVFQTNSKGAYEKSFLSNQHTLEQQITQFINPDLLYKVHKALRDALQEIYAPHYNGNIGVDMMVYRSGERYKLHPCVEINMRKSMGLLAIRLFESHLHPDTNGEFLVEYQAQPDVIRQKHSTLQAGYPLVSENGLIKKGYLNLCPVTETSNYHAYICMY